MKYGRLFPKAQIGQQCNEVFRTENTRPCMGCNEATIWLSTQLGGRVCSEECFDICTQYLSRGKMPPYAPQGYERNFGDDV